MNRFAVENLFGIKGFNIAWYGLIIAFGMLLGIALASYRSRKTGIKSDYVTDFLLWALPIAVICARIYYVAFEWDNYKNDLLSILRINEGGMAIYGGVIGGVITAIFFCKAKKISFFAFADTMIPSLVLGQAIGRWGNFVNQEAYGELITDKAWQFFPFAVYIDNVGQWHQATFFYESALNVILLVFMLLIYPKLKKNGYLLSFYMLGYGMIRFFVEGLRTDSLYLFPGLRISQALSAVLVVAGIAMLLLIKKNGSQKTVLPKEKQRQ